MGHGFPYRSSHGFSYSSSHRFRGLGVTPWVGLYFVKGNKTNVLSPSAPDTPDYHAGGIFNQIITAAGVYGSSWVVVKFDDPMVMSSQYGYINYLNWSIGNYSLVAHAYQPNYNDATGRIIIQQTLSTYLITNDFNIEDLTYNTRGSLNLLTPKSEKRLVAQHAFNDSYSMELDFTANGSHCYSLTGTTPTILYGGLFYCETAVGEDYSPTKKIINDVNNFAFSTDSPVAGLYRHKHTEFI